MTFYGQKEEDEEKEVQGRRRSWVQSWRLDDTMLWPSWEDCFALWTLFIIQRNWMSVSLIWYKKCLSFKDSSENESKWLHALLHLLLKTDFSFFFLLGWDVFKRRTTTENDDGYSPLKSHVAQDTVTSQTVIQLLLMLFVAPVFLQYSQNEMAPHYLMDPGRFPEFLYLLSLSDTETVIISL